MAGRGDSVVGIDLGKRAFKGAALRRRSDSRFVLTNYASREVPEEFGTSEELARQVKLLLKDCCNWRRYVLSTLDLAHPPKQRSYSFIGHNEGALSNRVGRV